MNDQLVLAHVRRAPLIKLALVRVSAKMQQVNAEAAVGALTVIAIAAK